MDRRRFVKLGIVVGAVAALGGCTDERLEEAESQPRGIAEWYDEEEVDLPVTQRFEIAEEAVLRAADAEIEDVDAFVAFLEAQNIAVEELEEKVEEGEEVLSVEYVVDELIDEGLMHHLGIVAGAYASLVEGGYDGDTLEASLRDADGRKYGEYEIRTLWATGYVEDEYTAAEYAGYVAHLAESKV